MKTIKEIVWELNLEKELSWKTDSKWRLTSYINWDNIIKKKYHKDWQIVYENVNGSETHYKYLDGKLIYKDTASGREKYRYNKKWLLSEVIDADWVISKYYYDNHGRVKKWIVITWNSKVVSNIRYNKMWKITKKTIEDDSWVFVDQEFKYDKLGNEVYRKDNENIIETKVDHKRKTAIRYFNGEIVSIIKYDKLWNKIYEEDIESNKLFIKEWDLVLEKYWDQYILNNEVLKLKKE